MVIKTIWYQQKMDKQINQQNRELNNKGAEAVQWSKNSPFTNDAGKIGTPLIEKAGHKP